MPRKFKGIHILSTTIILLLGGCGVPSTPKDLIEPPVPETSLQTGNISQDLIKLLPQKAQILSPVQEKAGNDISFGDMDGDGVDEAVIVYKEKNKTGKMLKAALFTLHQEQWHKISEVEGYGYGLDYVRMTDIDHDGRSELALGWSLGEAGNGLNIYSWRNDTLKLLSKKVYQEKPDLNLK
ncbi:hypothetical protein MUG84_11815 [Paenibacillus sp. KQZ6P-2]|uniref:VCBS repeat-containing protein n=1 Tax=Paenibacillus mangrovi TaxID=2931978 RepID=A0A9X2B2E3_9BACL|nr:hypothetical protein [Paenibacillus mangrovi]MCJ8012419.1 hypothetical protein [Paenibacillus mangrovi]